METVADYLQFVDGVSLGQSVESIVLKHGQTFKPAACPRDVRKGRQNECYANAYHVYVARGLQYVEGFAVASDVPIPLQHAWCVTADGKVVDNTWYPVGREYVGIPIPPHMIDEVLFASRTFGILNTSKPKFVELAKKLAWIEA